MLTPLEGSRFWNTGAFAAALVAVVVPCFAQTGAGERPELTPQAEVQFDRPNVFTVKTPTGKDGILLTSVYDGTVKWRDPNTGELLRTFPLSSWSVSEPGSILPVDTSLSPDGKILASAGMGNIVRLQDAWTGRLLHVMPGGRGPLLFSPDGKLLVGQHRVGEGAGIHWQARIWDVQTGHLLYTLASSFDFILSYNFTAEGRLLLGEYSSRGKTGKTETWNVATGELEHAPPQGSQSIMPVTHQPHEASESDFTKMTRRTAETVPMMVVARLRNGKVVVSDGTRLWNLFSGKLIQALPGVIPWVSAAAVSPDGRFLSGGGGSDAGGTDAGGKLYVWNVAHPQKSWGMHDEMDRANGAKYDREGNLWATSLAFSPDDRTLAVGSAMFHAPLTVYNVHTGALLWYPKELSNPPGASSYMVGGLGVFCTRFSQDGAILAAGGYGWRDSRGEVTLWNAKTGHLLRTLKQDEIVKAVAFSPYGKLLATGRAISTWLKEGLRSFEDPTGGAVELWNPGTGKKLHPAMEQGDVVKSLEFSHNGKLLASGSRDRTVCLWDTATGRLLHTLRGHGGAINSICFAADDRSVISASDDGTMKVWNVHDGRLLATLMFFSAHSTPAAQDIGSSKKVKQPAPLVEWLAYTPDGHYNASRGAERFLRWRVGDQLFPARRYKNIYFRPELVERAMEGR